MTTSEAFQAAVKAAINGDKNHGWGAEDSVAVIMAMIANENGGDVKDYVGSEIEGLVKAVVNPSAFRQKLEGKGVLNKQESKAAKTGKSVNDLLSSL